MLQNFTFTQFTALERKRKLFIILTKHKCNHSEMEIETKLKIKLNEVEKF